MKKVDYFTPMSPTDWDEFPHGSTRFDADIPLATEEDYEREDPDQSSVQASGISL